MVNTSGVGGTTSSDGSSQTGETTQTGGTSGTESAKEKTYSATGSIDQMLKEEPEFRKAVLEGLAQKICDDSRKAQEKIKKIRLESQNR